MKYVVNLENVNNHLFSVVGALRIENKCCNDKNVIITKTLGADVYSCQCECGGWCTTGCSSIEDAIRKWKKMN